MAEEKGKSLDDMTVSELRQRASELEITGRSSMNKEDLVQAVKDGEAQTASLNTGDTEWTWDDGPAAAKETPESESESKSESTSKSESKSSSDSKSSSTGDSSDGGGTDLSDVTAPSIGPNTTFDVRTAEERLDMDKISDVDAMGLDKRRQVQGKRYGASPAKQALVYGIFVAVVAALVIGGSILASNLDKPSDSELQAAEEDPPAPWAQETAPQTKPGDIDFAPVGDQDDSTQTSSEQQ